MNTGLIRKIIDSIAENIIQEARVDSSGISWDTMSRSVRPGQFEKKVSYNLQQGNLGIVLFLLTYYNNTKDKRLIEIIDLGLLKSYNFFKKNEDLIGFYSGRGGAIYTLIQASKVLDTKSYLDKAIELGLLNYERCTFNNLSEGYAGYLISILHLLDVSKNSQLVGIIKNICFKIISETKVKQDGIYWDEPFYGMKPINGFPYGNSGIVFALDQASKLFENTNLFDTVIEEALAYEDSSFNVKHCNWPDFLNEDYFFYNFKNHRKLFSQNYSKKFLDNPGNSFSWAFGSPGALLVRKDKILKNKNYSKSLAKSISIVESQQRKPKSDFCLSKGLGGIILSLLHLDHPVDTTQVLNGIIAQKKKYKEFLSSYSNNRKCIDLSLFNGESGIGYLLLQLEAVHKNVKNPSILYPFLDTDFKNEKKITYTKSEIHSAIIQGNCPITVESSEKGLRENETFFNHIESLISEARKSENLSDTDIVRIEIFKLMQKDLNFHYITRKEANNQTESKPIHPKYLSMGENCKLVKNSTESILLKRSAGKINIINLNAFGNALLEACEQKAEIKMKGIEALIIEMTDVTSSQEIDYVKQKVESMIRNFIKEGILEFR